MRSRRASSSGAKRGVQRHGRAVMQGRRRLDVQPSDMEQRQDGEHVIVGREPMHVLAHDAVPEQCLLAQHRALRPTRGPGGVDDKQRRREVDARVAARAAPRAEQLFEREAARRRKVEPDDACLRLRLGKRCDHGPKCLLDQERAARMRRSRMKSCSGDGKPPVQRHEHRAEPRAGIEQDEIVRDGSRRACRHGRRARSPSSEASARAAASMRAANPA